MDCQRQDATREANGPYAEEREELVPISALETWSVCEGEPDIRGWEVRTIGGRPLGEVGDLLIDCTAGEVVFLDIDLSGNNRRTFVPARLVRLDLERRLVVMDSADLPESDVPREQRANAIGRRATNAAIHYPSQSGTHRGAADRRPSERRRIDRVSSDF